MRYSTHRIRPQIPELSLQLCGSRSEVLISYTSTSLAVRLVTQSRQHHTKAVFFLSRPWLVSPLFSRSCPLPLSPCSTHRQAWVAGVIKLSSYKSEAVVFPKTISSCMSCKKCNDLRRRKLLRRISVHQTPCGAWLAIARRSGTARQVFDTCSYPGPQANRHRQGRRQRLQGLLQ